MKKIYSLFILSILALTMFVGCQMPTDGTGNGAEAVETEYTITVVAPHGTVELDKTKAKAGETVKLTKLEADNGYTFKTMSIKKENGEDVTEVDRQNQTFTMPESNVTVTVNFKEITPTYTVSVPSETYKTSSNSSYKLVIQNAPIDGYKKGDQVEILITNGNQGVNTGWGTPEGLYLVNVSIEDSNGNDIKSTVGLKVEDNKIKFTMPSNTVNVYAKFEDVVFKDAMVDYHNYGIDEGSPFWNEIIISVYGATNPFKVVMVFEDKDFDNLMSVDGKYVLYDKASYTESAVVSILSSYNLFNENTMTYKLGVDYGSKIISDDGITTKNLGGSGWLFTISIK